MPLTTSIIKSLSSLANRFLDFTKQKKKQSLWYALSADEKTVHLILGEKGLKSFKNFSEGLEFKIFSNGKLLRSITSLSRLKLLLPNSYKFLKCHGDRTYKLVGRNLLASGKILFELELIDNSNLGDTTVEVDYSDIEVATSKLRENEWDVALKLADRDSVTSMLDSLGIGLPEEVRRRLIDRATDALKTSFLAYYPR